MHRSVFVLYYLERHCEESSPAPAGRDDVAIPIGFAVPPMGIAIPPLYESWTKAVARNDVADSFKIVSMGMTLL